MKRRKRIVIALGGNALGNTLPEQMAAVKTTARAIVDLIEEGCEVVVAHGNGPQVGMINNAMIALTHEDLAQPNTPLSVCVAMSQAYIGYDLQNALREELLNRNIPNMPVATMITQIRVEENDPAFSSPSKPIGKFMDAEEAKEVAHKYDYVMKEDAGRGYRRVVASPKPVEIIEIETIRTMVDASDLVIACGGGGIPVVRKGNHLKGASAVIDKDFDKIRIHEHVQFMALKAFGSASCQTVPFQIGKHPASASLHKSLFHLHNSGKAHHSDPGIPVLPLYSFGHPHPGDHNPPAVLVCIGLRRVQIHTIIHILKF